MDDFMDEFDEKDRLKGDKKIPARILIRRMLICSLSGIITRIPGRRKNEKGFRRIYV